MTKLEQLKAHATNGNWHKAIAIAARFPSLGKERNAILDAHTAITNPRWMVGLGKDIDATIAAGVNALRIRYAL